MPKTRVVIDGKQECIGCHQWLPLESFGVYRASSTGRNWRCKECHKKTPFGGMTPIQRARKWQSEHPERYREINTESRKRVIFNAERLEKMRAHSNKCYHRNREKHIESHKKWRKNNA